MDPDSTLLAAGLGGAIVVIILLRLLFRSMRMNTIATDVSKVRETDLESEPVPLATYTRTLTMRERILLHLRYVASEPIEIEGTIPTHNEAIDAVTMGDLKGLHVALSAMESDGEIRSTGMVGSIFELTDEGRIRANAIHGDFIGSIVMMDGVEVAVGEAIGFEGFPLIGDHIES